jgi:hypothetical protein
MPSERSLVDPPGPGLHDLRQVGERGEERGDPADEGSERGQAFELLGLDLEGRVGRLDPVAGRRSGGLGRDAGIRMHRTGISSADQEYPAPAPTASIAATASLCAILFFIGPPIRFFNSGLRRWFLRAEANRELSWALDGL